MLKLIDLDSDYFREEPTVTILDFDSSRGMLKTAADSRINAYASTITPHPGRIYVHILAMGAGEYFGANRNADYFPEDNLIKYFKTFETSPAHIFKHHVNKNPDIAIGKVIFAVYNERMHRVEVIAWIDKEKGRDVVEKIERGEFPSTSMACHTPYDTCAICGNQARSRAEYCTHLKNELGRVYPDGRKVMAINNGPLKFFDMSYVFKPADVTSSILQKVAHTGGAVGSVENAEMAGLGLNEKSAQLRKLSELIKEVEGDVVGSSNSLQDILSRVKDPNSEILDLLVQFDLHHVLHAFAQLGISPSIGFFAKLIGQKLTGAPVEGIETLVQGQMQEDPEHVMVPLDVGRTDGPAPASLVSSLVPFVKQASLFPELIMQRVTSEPFQPVMYGPGSNVGFMQAGPHVEHDPKLEYRKLKEIHDAAEPGLLRTLYTISGLAAAAKWILSKMIDAEMQKRRESLEMQRGGPRIVLVKSAQEAVTTQELAKVALLNSLRGL